MARPIIFGEIPNIPEGHWFKGRKEMMPTSFHRNWGAGIDGNAKDEQIIIKYKKVPKTKADGTPSKVYENVVVDIVTVDGKTKAEVNKRVKIWKTQTIISR